VRQVFGRPESLKEAAFRFCPGCGHSILHRLMAECIDEMGLRELAVGIAPVGCAVFAYDYFDFDIIEVPHGRPPAAATAIKRLQPDRVVLSYQGDGDLAAIGTAEILHAANRGENFTVFFVNNGIYGMTGGQLAPTTLCGQRTTTTPGGRQVCDAGHPLKVAELISVLDGPAFVARSAVDTPANVMKTKKLFEKAIRYQVEGKGFCLVEVLSPCPTSWRMTPEEALKWVSGEMQKVFPLGTFKDRYSGGEAPN
jgi:2-oxoglutarate ferredoxin oxidoreductase subunit beta